VKRFRFPLDRLRAWRQLQLDGECARLAELLAGLDLLSKAREEIRRQERESCARIGSAPVVAVEELQALDAFRRWAGAERGRLRTEEQALQSRITGQRGAVVEARRRVESLDRLREKRLQSWRAEVDRQTESAVAELVIARWRWGE
jgi:flagellar export protein FliJ